MRVRMVQQVSGTRDGAPWPAPGEYADLSDDEANTVITGGAAVADDADRDTILVAPDGVHTPGMLAFQEPGVQHLVEVPVDAVADPQGVRDALKARADANYTEVPVGVGTAHRDGTAFNADKVDDSKAAEERVRGVYASPAGGTGASKSSKAAEAKAEARVEAARSAAPSSTPAKAKE